jgi:DDE family transposase
LYKSLFDNEHAENRSGNDLQETTMTQDTHIVLPFASLSGKRLQADGDGGALSSDGGVLFLRETEAHLGVMRRFVKALDDRRDPRYTDPSDEELVRQRMFQMACGSEDANDGDSLRRDPACKAACERWPIVGEALASQPTMSRLDHAPRRSDRYRMAPARLETLVASSDRVPKALLLALEDTADEGHGAHQQALFPGSSEAYGSLPLHRYAGQSGKLITSMLRPGCRPTGAAIVSMRQRVVGAMRRAWPAGLIVLRGDGPLSTPEVPQWCESPEPVIVSILGQSGHAVLQRAAAG